LTNPKRWLYYSKRGNTSTKGDQVKKLFDAIYYLIDNILAIIILIIGFVFMIIIFILGYIAMIVNNGVIAIQKFFGKR